MSSETKIEWCDSTFNPWEGCTKVSPGCDHCYAEARNTRFGGGEAANWGQGAPRRRTSAANWRKPLAWNKRPFYCCCNCEWRGETLRDDMCPACGCIPAETRRRVFCASLADWLDNEAPIEWLVDLLDLIRRTPNLDWLLLTKRIGNWDPRLRKAAGEAGAKGENGSSAASDTWGFIFDWLNGWPPENVWLGATVVNQAEADRDIPKLLATPATVRFLSMEPLLGPVDFAGMWVEHGNPAIHENVLERLDWIIVGGESGANARWMCLEWVRSLRDQCEATGTPFLFKQWGEWVSTEQAVNDLKPGAHEVICFDSRPLGPTRGGSFTYGNEFHYRPGKRMAGRLLDGRTWDQFPRGGQP